MPESVSSNFRKDRRSNPAQLRTTRAQPISPMTKAFLNIAWRTPPTEPRELSRSVCCIPSDIAKAGSNPQRVPTKSDRRSVKQRAPVSIRISDERGSRALAERVNNSIPQLASTTPKIPPTAASKRLSASNCCTNRQRLAPNEARMASSRRRLRARDNNRFAKLNDATKSMQPTDPCSSSSAGRCFPTMSS